MLFRKKKPTSRARMADVIEHAMVSGLYYNDQLGHRYMCIVLYQLVEDGYITERERLDIADAIMGRLGGKKTLIGYFEMCGVDLLAVDEFERRITLCNNWWRYIRILRGQPFLETRYD